MAPTLRFGDQLDLAAAEVDAKTAALEAQPAARMKALEVESMRINKKMDQNAFSFISIRDFSPAALPRGKKSRQRLLISSQSTPHSVLDRE